MVLDPELIRDPLAGTRYRALERIGSGAMGEVWLSEHRATGRKCVAKLLLVRWGDNAQIVDRMRIEAQTLGRLRHPNVVNILGASVTVEGRPFIVLEYLRGKTLREAMNAGPLPMEDALRFAEELVSAIAKAHSMGIVHRDIKPQNMILAERRDVRSLKVLDFGVARVLPTAPEGAPSPLVVPTREGAVIGTPQWMSPEMRRGQPADEQADLFAAGLILYEMTVGARLSNLDEGVKELPSDLVPERSCAPLDAILRRALDPNPRHRFIGAEHFLDELIQLRRLYSGLMRAAKEPPVILTVARPVLIRVEPRVKPWMAFVAAAIVSAGLAICVAQFLG